MKLETKLQTQTTLCRGNPRWTLPYRPCRYYGEYKVECDYYEKSICQMTGLNVTPIKLTEYKNG